MDEVCGFWPSSGQNPGQSVQIVPAGRSRLTRTRKGQGFKALRLADEIYPYQLAADPLRRGSATNVGPLKKGGSGKSKKSLGDIGKM
jgi:hypothetical protein